MAEKMVLILHIYFIKICSDTVVQWSRNCLQGQMNRVLLPATLISVTLCRSFFFLFSIFLIHNPFLLFSFILTAHPADHALGSIYILSLSQESFILEKGFQKFLICILRPSLLPEKNISCQDMSLL